MIASILNNARAEYAKRWEEFQNLSRHEKYHLAAFTIIGFITVFGLLDLACR